ncbi:hypothetical protein J4N46_01580 [Capnocytophaga sp. Marseille-Q4570]|jgi:hypothetical protein|uniref:Uncharacterized protein n=1 Tax=Capnocytophaga bilenii TaxID=2819369 RepID=A0ABS3PV06_9FLAO|nr:hypothetical protein [Capnocytophaga bilenii]MBO1883149.1 hypothetical protein [Capnocytophaga bilenii]
MTAEEKKDLEKYLWDKFKINVHFTEFSTKKYDPIKNSFPKKLAEANAMLKKMRFPEGFFDQKESVGI